MSISYSGIIGAGTGKAILPSVESWSTNNSILRDPPKSIMTRKIDKISDTSSLTQLCDESGDRVCEAISVYARGVNPMVSVSYGNEGNNSGGNGSIVGGQNGGKQAYLPYRIMKDGVFRPPILTPYQLLPISRQPRASTSNFTQPSFIDFSKKITCPDGNYREVKEKTFKASVRPTATFKMNSQVVEPFEVKYVIKNPTKFDSRAGLSGIRTRDLTYQEVSEPTKAIYGNPLNVEDVYTNQGSNNTLKYVDNSHLNIDRYIQDPLNVEDVYTNQGTNNTLKYVDNSHLNTDRYIQDALNVEDVYTNQGTNNTLKYVDNSHLNIDRYIQDPLNVEDVYTNQGTNNNLKYVDNSHFNTDRYLQDALHSSVQSKMSASIQVTPIEDIINVDIRTKNPINISYTPLKTGYSKEDYIHDDLDLHRRVIQTEAVTNKNNPNIFVRHEIEHLPEAKRNMPTHQISTNQGTTSRLSNLDVNDREYHLKPTINPGGFEGRGQIPTTNRIDRSTDNGINGSALSDKARRDKLIMNMQEGRYAR
jgi:hypothetical protein